MSLFNLGWRFGLGFWLSLIPAVGVVMVMYRLLRWLLAKFFVLEGVRYL